MLGSEILRFYKVRRMG